MRDLQSLIHEANHYAQAVSGGSPQNEDFRQLKRAMSELRKSLVTAGYQTPAVTTGNANGPYSPIYPEALDDHFTKESFKLEDEIRILSDLQSKGAWKEATQTVEQVPVLIDRGNLNPIPIAFAEGGVPGTTKSNLTRRTCQMKYVGKTVHVTDQAAFIRGIADKTALDWETLFNMETLMREMDHAIWHADARIDSLEYNGFFEQMETSGLGSQVIYDYRGQDTSMADLQDAIFQASRAFGGYSRATDIYLSPEFEMQFDRDETTKVRHVVGDGRYPGGIEYGIGADRGWTINLGSVMGTKVPIHGTKALDPTSIGNCLQDVQPVGESGDIPSTPVLAGAPDIGADADSLFVAGDAGDYNYAILAVGAKGVSAPLFVKVGGDSQLAVAAGESVSFEITAPNDGKTKYYRIFRTEKDVNGNASNPRLVRWYLIGRAAHTAGVNTEFVDVNAKIAGCSDVAILNFSPEFIQFRELLPLMRRGLMTLDTTQKFLLMQWGNLHVRSPIKHRVLRNVKPVPYVRS